MDEFREQEKVGPGWRGGWQRARPRRGHSCPFFPFCPCFLSLDSSAKFFSPCFSALDPDNQTEPSETMNLSSNFRCWIFCLSNGTVTNTCCRKTAKMNDSVAASDGQKILFLWKQKWSEEMYADNIVLWRLYYNHLQYLYEWRNKYKVLNWTVAPFWPFLLWKLLNILLCNALHLCNQPSLIWWAIMVFKSVLH